jgi:hypothetical protein
MQQMRESTIGYDPFADDPVKLRSSIWE